MPQWPAPLSTVRKAPPSALAVLSPRRPPASSSKSRARRVETAAHGDGRPPYPGREGEHVPGDSFSVPSFRFLSAIFFTKPTGRDGATVEGGTFQSLGIAAGGDAVHSTLAVRWSTPTRLMLRYFVRRIVSPGDSIGVPILFFQYPSGLQDSTLMNESGSALPSRNQVTS